MGLDASLGKFPFRFGGMRIFIFFILTLLVIVTLSAVLPYFQEIEASDFQEENNLETLTSQESEIIASTPFIIPLYYKTPQNLFLNETRANIFEVVTDNPGITFGAITRELNLAPGECQYHIRVLEREGYIKSKRTGKYTRYYLVGQKASEVSKIQEQILVTIKEKEGLSQTEIAEELGVSRQVVNYNIKPLVKDGYVVEIKENNRCCYHSV